MIYCTKCRAVSEEGTQKCPNCKNVKALREAESDDMAYLCSCDKYTSGLLAEKFEAANIAFSLEKFGSGRVSYLYDSEVMPTDKSVYVKFADFDKARAAEAEVRERLQKEIEAEQQEEFGDMSPKKRVVIQIISVVLFLLAIVVVVLFADFIASSIKSFFTGLKPSSIGNIPFFQ